RNVTGVQTCALPISGWGAFGGELLARPGLFQVHDGRLKAAASGVGLQVETPLRNWTWDPAEPVNVQLRMEGAELDDLRNALGLRSEERRVGKDGRDR